MSDEWRTARALLAGASRNNSMLPDCVAETFLHDSSVANRSQRLVEPTFDQIERRPRGRDDTGNIVDSGNVPLTTIPNGPMTRGFSSRFNCIASSRE
ncbi:MAG: hypothetical protein KGK33_13000 [Hyphomicrobiales bacterium]|nr:hypothetical protein [Hyphomicrobiales bacterium]